MPPVATEAGRRDSKGRNNYRMRKWGKLGPEHSRFRSHTCKWQPRGGTKPHTKYPYSSHTPKFCASSRLPFARSEEHTSELQSLAYLECRILLENTSVPSR